jgi:guanylate kinase
VEGVNYCFLSQEKFEQMVGDGKFLEYAHVHLNYYGTPLESVEKIRNRGEDCMLVIDVQGGVAARAKVPDAVMIFLAPPSMEELERRLRGRGTESDAAMEKRLANAQKEIDCIPNYDYLVVNDNIDEAVRRIEGIILAERARIKRYE